MKRFISSILNFGPWFTPYKVQIDEKYVVCSRNNGASNLYLTTSKVSIKKETITNYSIIDNLFWCDLKIISSSGERVILRHFSMTDAHEILSLIHS